MIRLGYFLGFLVLAFCGIVAGANGQSETCRWLPLSEAKDSFLLDSLSVQQESIKISDSNGETFSFEYSLSTGEIKIKLEEAGPDSLLLCYRTFPYAFHQGSAKRTLMVDYDSMAMFKDNRVQAAPAFDFREELFPSTNLNKSGNLTRGVSFGNTQNLFVNSSLNLQMNGQLSDNLNIRASITDQNVPFQPEGNTQQLQDFDNVLVELYNDKINLAAGDVVLQQRKSEFLRYYKNVQGAQLTSNYTIGEKWRASSQGSASVAKGKFASIILEISEGTLGPYRIPGPQNERFVIIMANSERVFLDGKQLQRGFNYDYVIDYNQGEITFTPNVLITQYSRVRVDFEYAERNFSRSILTANHIQETDNITLYMNFYREQDNRNRPLFFEFSDADKRLLASVGNDLDAASVPRVDSVAFDTNRVLYRRVQDVDDQGLPIVYYEYSTNPEEAHFAVAFSEVGQGNGDYVRDRQIANGPVFSFRPRVNGVQQGNYSILSPLPAPNKRQMFTTGARVKLSAFEEAYTELAFSNRDDNLFSELDNETNQGFGIKSGVISENRTFDKLKGYKFNALTEFEYNSSNFSFIDRLRYIEFDRDWSLTPEDAATAGHERIFNTQLEFQKDLNNLATYRFNFRNRGNILSGTQHMAKWNQQIGKRFFVKNDFFLLDSDVRDFNSSWIRYTGDLQYRSKVLVPGYRVMLDRNAVRDTDRDSVVSTAMNFLEHMVYLNSNDTLPYSFFVNATVREDKFPLLGELTPDTEAFQTMFGLKRRFKGHDLSATFTYRELEFLRTDQEKETTVLGKVDYLGTMWKGNVRNELSYALGNGREFRREFVFLPVPTGEGTHAWRDDNGDGIQQLNEFYIAINPEEKNFIKVFVPTTDFVQAFTTIFNYRLNAKFPDAWRKEGGFRQFLQRFSNTSSVSIEKKITSNEFWDRINPFVGGFADEDLISVRQVIRSSFFFNRSSAKYGFDFSVFDSQNKQLLAGGFDDLIQKDLRLNTRYNFNPNLNLRLIAQTGARIANSDFLDNRNYNVEQFGMGPELAWQPSSIFRTTVSYNYTDKLNIANTELEERANLHQTGLDFRYAKAIKTTVNANFRYIFINYNGVPNSPAGYEMLQALTVGSNVTWTFNWLQKIGEGLQMNMVYEGRNSEGLGRLVHIGRMQVTALF
ncbi:hypothetical protein A33Q_4469 [Indibacter alkaliphilus LW1]|uniref:Uncharacterized protein n=1 Tax=Indibacter alkaliphilus (strain CCUG 57479 / KCTC 22604 / LW1) TaxID=1189612 RepID=S2DK46_INDAL|nr:hypothetical protein [Indibacter alkaliphilus]EOZ92376.1 hypothetical protein A33Q_4469 [Indibacter alkaliphilus LW1]